MSEPALMQAALRRRHWLVAHGGRSFAFAAGLALVAGGLDLLESERFTAVAVTLILCSLGALSLVLWRSHKIFVALLAAQVVVLFAYTWSLGEQVPVKITITPTEYIANVEGNIRTYALPKNQTSSPTLSPRIHISLFTGTDDEFSVTPLGAIDVQKPKSALDRLAWYLRFLSPGSSWADVRISRSPGSKTKPADKGLLAQRGTWSVNPRGEVSGSSGALLALPAVKSKTLAFSADLMRPDGEMGVVVGSAGPRTQAILVIRMDTRQAWWRPWTGADPPRWNGAPQPWPQFPVDVITMLQYLLRTLLPSVLIASVLGAFSCLTYAVLSLFSTGLNRTRRRSGRKVEDDRFHGKDAELAVREVHVPFFALVRRFPRTRRLGLSASAALDAIALSVAATATVVMSVLATYTYQRLPTTQDDVVDLFEAKTLALGRISAPVPHNADFFTQWSMLILHHQWFGKYPPGWPLVLAAGVLAHAEWLVNPVVSGIGVLLVYLIARELFGRPVALLAQLLFAASPYVLFIGSAYYAQPAVWLFLGVYVYLVLVWYGRNAEETGGGFRFRFGRSAWLLALAGLAFGLAVATRQLDAVAFATPFVLLILRRFFALLWLAAGAAIPGALFAGYNYVLTRNWLPSGYVLNSSWDRPGFGKDVGGVPHSYFANFTPAISLSNITGELEDLHLSLFGWPYFLALALVSLPFVLGKARKGDWLILCGGLSVVFAYFFFWWPGIDQSSFPRYWYLVVPCFAILAARGAQEMYRLPLTIRLPGRPSLKLGAVAPAAVIVLGLAFNLDRYTPALNYEIAFWNRDDSAPLKAVAAANIHHAIIFQVAGVDHWHPYGCVFDQNSPIISRSSIIWAHDRGGYDARLMRKFPTRSYYRLNGAILTPLTPATSVKKPPYVKPFLRTQQCGTTGAYKPTANAAPAPAGGIRRPIAE